MTIKNCCARLGIRPQTLQAHIQEIGPDRGRRLILDNRKLPARKLGRVWLIDEVDLEEWLHVRNGRGRPRADWRTYAIARIKRQIAKLEADPAPDPNKYKRGRDYTRAVTIRKNIIAQRRKHLVELETHEPDLPRSYFEKKES